MQAGGRQNHGKKKKKKKKTIRVEDATKIKKTIRDTPGDAEDENNGVSHSGDGKHDNILLNKNSLLLVTCDPVQVEKRFANKVSLC